MLKIKRNPILLVISKDQPLYVSLEKMIITATIRSLTADVIITQVFRNNENTLIEAVYYFPIEKQETVYAFTARIDDREITTQTKNNNNNTLDQDYKTDSLKENNFIIDVGALPPSKECTITVVYTTKLNFIHESTIQFIVPITVASLLNTNTGYFPLKPYTVEFHCNIEETNESQHQQQIIQVSSTSHPVQVHFTEQNTYVVTFMQENTYLDRNISINIELADTIMHPQQNNTTTASNSIKENCHHTLTNEHNFHSDCDNCASKIITTNSVGQPFDYYCVLDFEAVCHQADPSLKRPSSNDIWEIIEFPICLLEAETNTIIDTYHSYVRPTMKTSLNEICISITGITQDIVDNSPTFDIVWKDVQRFLAKHSLIPLDDNTSSLHSFTWITCGNWDLRTMLPLQLKQCGYNRPGFINNFINLKDLYMEYYPLTRIRGMKDMLKKSNLILEGRHHSGIDDTKNIARIAQWLIKNNKILKLTYKAFE